MIWYFIKSKHKKKSSSVFICVCSAVFVSISLLNFSQELYRKFCKKFGESSPWKLNWWHFHLKSISSWDLHPNWSVFNPDNIGSAVYPTATWTKVHSKLRNIMQPAEKWHNQTHKQTHIKTHTQTLRHTDFTIYRRNRSIDQFSEI